MSDATLYFDGDTREAMDATSQLESRLTDFARTTSKLLSGIFAGVWIDRIIDAGKFLIAQSREQEAAIMALDGVYENVNKTIGFTRAQLADMAEDLSHVTTFSADTTTKVQSLIAVFRNVQGDQFRDVVRLSQDMTGVFGDVESAAQTLGRALNDPTKSFRGLAQAGIALSEAQQRQIQGFIDSGQLAKAQTVILDELKGRYAGVAEAQASTNSGKAIQRQNQVNDAYADMGKILDDTISKFQPLVSVVVESFVEMIGIVQDFTEYLIGAVSFDTLGSWQDVLDWYQTKTVEVVTAIEIAFTRTGDLGTLAWKKIQLSAIGYYEDTKHFFGTAMPEYLNWLGENWIGLFTDIGSFTLTVFENMGKNVTEFFTSLYDWLSGKGGSFEFTALAEGFEATVDKLPDIAARAMSETEKSLAKDVAKLGQDLSDDFAKRRAMNLAATRLGDKEENPLDFGGAAAEDRRGPWGLIPDPADAASVLGKAFWQGAAGIAGGINFLDGIKGLDTKAFDQKNREPPAFQSAMSAFERIRQAAGSKDDEAMELAKRQAKAVEEANTFLRPVRDGIDMIVKNTEKFNPLAILGQ